DMSHEHRRHPYMSHPLQPLIPNWNSSIPTPIQIIGEAPSCNSREHQRMMPYQSNPTMTGQTQPTVYGPGGDDDEGDYRGFSSDVSDILDHEDEYSVYFPEQYQPDDDEPGYYEYE